MLLLDDSTCTSTKYHRCLNFPSFLLPQNSVVQFTLNVVWPVSFCEIVIAYFAFVYLTLFQTVFRIYPWRAGSLLGCDSTLQ